jgi:hypothetical protein
VGSVCKFLVRPRTDLWQTPWAPAVLGSRDGVDAAFRLDRVGLLCSLVGVLLIPALVDPAAAADAPITFSVIGDIPYGTSELDELEEIVEDHNVYSPSDFFVHVGDIKSGSEPCTEPRYATVARILHDLAVPAFILPGDNEWNDCPDPDQAWGYWTEHLLGLEQDFCGIPSDFEAQPVRPENFAFTAKGVLFVGLNLVGGATTSKSERKMRLQQNADWVNQKLAQHGSGVRALVVFGHAGPSSGRALFFDQFVAAAAGFGKPVLYVHGDGHAWILDRPFSVQSILRVQVPMGEDGPVQVLASLDPLAPFSVVRDPWPWPKSARPFNKPPCVEAEAESPIAFGSAAGLGGFVTDDGDPDPPGGVVTLWSQVSGPAPVAIADPGALETSATFPEAGSYVLRLGASDGGLQTSRDVSIDVVGLVVDDVFVSEEEDGVFTVNLRAAQGDPVTVSYATSDGTARAPEDYSPRSGTLSFSGATTTRTISVPVLADVTIEGTESFLVNLTSPSGAPLAKAQGVAVVLDPDATLPPVLSSFTPSSGPPQSEVTVSGARFTGTTEVDFGGVSATSFTVDSDARIRAVAPTSASGPISVTTPNGSDTSVGSFVVLEPPACSNGLDDDADDLADFPADPGCRDAESATESPQCDDGVDNDGDGGTDWDGGPAGGRADRSCEGRGWRTKEGPTRCGLGFEVAVGVPFLAWGRRRRSPGRREATRAAAGRETVKP